MNQRSSTSRPPARPGGTSTAVTIVLVVVTALVGLFILNQISDDSSSGGGGGQTDTTEPVDTSLDTTTSTTVPTADMSLAKVIVANGAGVKGLAGSTTAQLQAAFPTATFIAATDANAKYQASAVYYLSGFEAQAGEIATSLGLQPSGLFPPALPLLDPTKIVDANILVLLGADMAGGVTVTPPVQADSVTETTATTAPPST